jgi:putative methylase
LIVRRAELVRRLDAVPPFANPRPELEQVATPAEAAAELLESALVRGDLEGKAVADLGSGTGRLAIGAGLLGASSVIGWESDEAAVAVAERAAAEVALTVRFEVREVRPPGPKVDTVVMNPPFGAQRARADRPFWEAALEGGAEAIYAFALADSRSFIERRVVGGLVQLEERRPIPWSLPATFAHHRRRTVPLAVDLWILRTGPHR